MTKIERLYSEAFEDGVNYAVEKMFTSKEDLEKYGNKIDTSDLTKKHYFPQIFGVGTGRISGTRAGARAAKKAIQAGDSDEEVERKARKAAAIRASISATIATGGIYKTLNKLTKPTEFELGIWELRGPGAKEEAMKTRNSFKLGLTALAAINSAAALYGSQRDSKRKAQELIERRENRINQEKLKELGNRK